MHRRREPLCIDAVLKHALKNKRMTIPGSGHRVVANRRERIEQICHDVLARKSRQVLAYIGDDQMRRWEVREEVLTGP